MAPPKQWSNFSVKERMLHRQTHAQSKVSSLQATGTDSKACQDLIVVTSRDLSSSNYINFLPGVSIIHSRSICKAFYKAMCFFPTQRIYDQPSAIAIQLQLWIWMWAEVPYFGLAALLAILFVLCFSEQGQMGLKSPDRYDSSFTYNRRAKELLTLMEDQPFNPNINILLWEQSLSLRNEVVLLNWRAVWYPFGFCITSCKLVMPIDYSCFLFPTAGWWCSRWPLHILSSCWPKTAYAFSCLYWEAALLPGCYFPLNFPA